jgi:multidrug efflux pump subunit AcrB
VFSFFETSTPQLYLDIDRTKAQMLGDQRAGRVQRAADLYRLVLRQRLQPVRPHLPRHRAGRERLPPRSQGRAQHPGAQHNGDTVPLGSFTTVRDVSGPYRVPRYNLYPAAELDGAAAPGYSLGQAITRWRSSPPRRCRMASPSSGRRSPIQQIKAGNTAVFAFVLAVVFVFLVLAAQYESLTLPLAVIMIVPMCLVPRSSAWCCADRTTTS